MREVTIFWSRPRLYQVSVGEVLDIFEHAVFLGYIERNPKVVKAIIRCVCVEGKTPHDLSSLGEYEVEEVLVEPSDLEPAWIVVVAIKHPLTLLAAKVGRLTVRPGSRLDGEGLHYIIRGSPMAIRIVVTAARMMLRPDRISATSITRDDLEGNPLLSERQMEVLQAAWDAGWYDIPRQITLGDLSKKLDLGRSTVSEHLVRAEGTIIDYFLHGDPTLFDDIIPKK
jgi:hypothetical protein